MAAITPTAGTGASNTGYSVPEFWQALANAHASHYWAVPNTTWTVSGDTLTIVGADAFTFFVDGVTGDLRDERKMELCRLPRPSEKRYMTAAVSGGDTVELTLSDTYTSLSNAGRFDGQLFGVAGESF